MESASSILELELVTMADWCCGVSKVVKARADSLGHWFGALSSHETSLTIQRQPRCEETQNSLCGDTTLKLLRLHTGRQRTGSHQVLHVLLLLLQPPSKANFINYQSQNHTSRPYPNFWRRNHERGANDIASLRHSFFGMIYDITLDTQSTIDFF